MLALVGKAVGMPPAHAPVSPFGASVPVHVAHVGHIEVDVEGSAGPTSLLRVRCAGAVGAGTACYVSAR